MVWKSLVLSLPLRALLTPNSLSRKWGKTDPEAALLINPGQEIWVQAPPGSQASSRGEAKDYALLSSRDAPSIKAINALEQFPVSSEPASVVLNTLILPNYSSGPPAHAIAQALGAERVIQ